MHLIDLTIPWGPEVEPVPGHPHIYDVPIHHHELHGLSTSYATFSIHTGTHIDAPYHFIKDGLTIDRVPLEWLNGPAVLVDLRSQARPGQPFTVDAVQAAAGDADLRDRRAVLWSGWAQAKWNDRAFYRDNPYLSNEAAQWLVRTGVRALGVDFAVDGGPPKPPGQPKYPVHLITLGADVCLIENLINLNQIGRRHFTLLAMPVPVKNGNGGPARVAAWVDE
ncbi:MAG: cyclase family protein [Bacillati bacterium ANGP1]|uniref:Cyclase family protein n=1 Tax=Candidatus Segetimicrobium genomatis TaxID=2569760 RepID=A0A537LKT9_9BACT|nr:MAG: cyclase family protein [Terrabacteria group bacterium ANGP1]